MLSCNMAYREFFNSIKFREFDTAQYRSDKYNCQMHELMFQAGVKEIKTQTMSI